MAAPTLRDAESYVTRGLVYWPGVFDCGSLVVLVQRELFGRQIRLAAAGERSQGRLGQAREIAEQQLATRVDEPVTGCAVLFWQTQGGGRQWHIGTAFLHLGTVWVLHASNETHGVVLRRLTELTSQGMHLEGFYQWL